MEASCWPGRASTGTDSRRAGGGASSNANRVISVARFAMAITSSTKLSRPVSIRSVSCKIRRRDDHQGRQRIKKLALRKDVYDLNFADWIGMPRFRLKNSAQK